MEQPTIKLANIKLIVGLGNPGPRYRNTRHNAGFLLLDAIVEHYGQHSTWNTSSSIHSTEISIPLPDGTQHTITLLKPMTGMNVSGIHVKPFLKKGISPEQIVVCYDELEKPFGKNMIRFSGSARGHNGVRSMIEQIGNQFWQLRLGIGRPENKADVGNYVLESFTQEEQERMDSELTKALTLLGL